MNRLQGNIIEIESSGTMSVVSVRVSDVVMRSVVLENPETASYLKKGNTVALLFNATEVVIGLGDVSNISLQNKIPGTIDRIKKGKFLGKIDLQTPLGNIEAMISARAIDELHLKEGSRITAMIKLNEIMLQPV